MDRGRQGRQNRNRISEAIVRGQIQETMFRARIIVPPNRYKEQAKPMVRRQKTGL